MRFAPNALGRSNRCVSVVAMACIALMFFAGCGGYKLGPTGGYVAGAKSVQVVPFLNETLEPRLGDDLTQAVRKQLQRDGTFRLATKDDGDIIVSGTIIGYQRLEQSLSRTDAATPEDIRLRMTTHIIARERSTQKVLLDQQVMGYTLVRMGNDLVSVERQALPLLAADVAKNVTALLADGAW